MQPTGSGPDAGKLGRGRPGVNTNREPSRSPTPPNRLRRKELAGQGWGRSWNSDEVVETPRPANTTARGRLEAPPHDLTGRMFLERVSGRDLGEQRVGGAAAHQIRHVVREVVVHDRIHLHRADLDACAQIHREAGLPELLLERTGAALDLDVRERVLPRTEPQGEPVVHVGLERGEDLRGDA